MITPSVPRSMAVILEPPVFSSLEYGARSDREEVRGGRGKFGEFLPATHIEIL